MSSVPKSSQTIANVNALRANIRGLASAGFMMAFFGAAWWGWGIGGIQGAFPGETVAFLIMLALATIILVNTMIGNLHAWDVLVGSTCAVILWLTGIYAELRGRSFLKQAQGQLGAG